MLDPENALLYANHPHWMMAAAHLLRQTPEHEGRAKDILDGVRRTCRERPSLYLELFVNLDRTGNEDAIRDLAELIPEDVNDPLLVNKLSAKFYKWGELNRALDLCERQLRRTPDDDRVLAQHARILIGLNRVEAALGSLRKLIEADPQNQWAHINIARTLNKLGRNSEALEALERLLEMVANDPQGLAFKGRLLWQEGRFDEAAEAVRRAVDAAPDDAFVVQNAQMVLRAIGPRGPSAAQITADAGQPVAGVQ
jgi:tetratricopeptide (TPR) repeat protein